MPRNVSHPDEVIVLKRRFGTGAADIEKYIEQDGYRLCNWRFRRVWRRCRVGLSTP